MFGAMFAIFAIIFLLKMDPKIDHAPWTPKNYTPIYYFLAILGMFGPFFLLVLKTKHTFKNTFEHTLMEQ